MNWDTLPYGIWIIYYTLLFLTVGMAIFIITKKQMLLSSTITIVLTILTPITSLLYSIGREEGMNEFEHMVKSLYQGEIWSICVLVFYMYLISWWTLILKSKMNR